MFVTFFDTCMVSLVAMFVWRFSPYLVFFPWLIIACLDGTYLSSALTKVPDGAWFTLTLAAILAAIFLVWRFGKEQQWIAESEDRYPTSHFVRVDREGEMRLTDRFEGTNLAPFKGFAMFFDKAGETTPIVFSQFALKLTAAPEIMVFFHLRPLESPSVPPEERHTVSRLAIPNCYRLVVRYGYNDEVITPDLASVVHEQLRNYIIQNSDDDHHGNGATNDAEVTAENGVSEKERVIAEESQVGSRLARLDRAFAHKVIYIIGKEQMKIKKETNFIRKTLLHIFLWMRENSRNKMANLNLETSKIIEIGFLKAIS